MFDTRARKERRIGGPLFLKPFRSATGKSAITRRPAKPGQHGAARRRGSSEFGKQLLEKQKIRYTYGLREAQLRNAFAEANASPLPTGQALLMQLERRLDNVVYRLAIAPSRSVGRQVVGHGHIFVNKRRVKAPSYRVKAGDVISIRPQSREFAIFKDLAERLPKAQTPNWLVVNPQTAEGTVKMLPKDVDAGFDISLVVDYYSKIVK
jgi:small subunit ribosomal protein S4